MRAAEIIQALQRIAPLEHAAEWDNVGLLLGSPEQDVGSALLTIDLTEPVLEEAQRGGAQMIVAYHPPIFHPLKSLTDRTGRERVVLGAARAGMAIYSPHTALDAAPGGVNDWLASGAGSGDVRALEPVAALPANEQCKVVTFCPPEAAEQLRNAMAAVGAGRIGDYELCSFELHGQGTFRGGAGTNPAVGQAGRLERVDEVRLEMVCPREALGLLVVSLRQFHPYEEPPIEIYQLQRRPQRGTGMGRRVVLDQRIDLRSLAERVKKLLGVPQVRVALGRSGARRFRTIGLCAGAGGSLLEAAAQQGCELFITGEMSHHDVIAAQEMDCAVMLAGHTNTERGYLKVLREKLGSELPDLAVTIARRDGDPLRAV